MARRQRVSARNGETKGPGEERTADPKGLTKLSQAADKTLDKHGSNIASVLGDHAAAGDIACAMLLVELAERKKRKKRGPRAKRVAESLAEELEREPEWPGAEAAAGVLRGKAGAAG